MGLDPEVKALRGSGLYHWAVGGIDLKELAERASAAGLTGSDLVTGGRSLPDGKWLGWKCFGIHNHRLALAESSLTGWTANTRQRPPPARRLPCGGLRCSRPRRKYCATSTESLGLKVTVTEAAAAGVSVTLESSKGRHVLRMFDPVPQGYVI